MAAAHKTTRPRTAIGFVPNRPWHRQTLGAPRATQRGAALVEAALVTALFLSLLFTIIDLSLMGFANLTMQHAVRDATRYAVTGRADLDPDEEGDRYAAVIERMRRSSLGLYDYMEPVVEIKALQGGVQVDVGESFGNPGDIIIVQVNCNWPVLTPFLKPFFDDGEYLFGVSSTMRNEEFPTS